MTIKKEKGFRRLNKTHVWSVFSVISLMGLIICVALIFFVRFFLRYSLESRVMNEYDSFSHMIELAADEKDGGKKIYDFYGNDGKEFYIKDKDGKEICSYGDITADDSGILVYLESYGKTVKMFSDKETKLIYPEAGELSFDVEGFAELFIDQKGKDEEEIVNLKVLIPIWMEVPAESDDMVLTGKMNFIVDVHDIVLAALFIIILTLLIIFVAIIFLVYTIKSVVRQRKLTNLFFMDDTTGGKNWMWFTVKGEHMLKKRINARNRYAVLDVVFINYRNFCVCHSIAEGEKMLQNVEKLINANIDKREMCAHYASANFAVLLKVANEEALRKRVEDLLTKLESMDRTHKFTFRVGVDIIDVEVDRKGKIVRRRHLELEEEYNNACTARATLEDNNDSGIAFFNEELVRDRKWVDTVTERQFSALRNEEFVVYYQPKYDPKSDKLVGAEALIRWNYKEEGRTEPVIKGPGEFIPIFEKNGFITEIDHYMLTHVAKDQKAWLEAGLDCVPISVNLSRAHFIEPDLAEQIRDAVDSIGTPHRLIELELTESAFFDDKKALVTTIKRLKEYGFTVSMDDFGSGYSSLNSLKDMPLDVLKLDADFFRGDYSEGDRGEIVVAEAIQLAKKLNMRTVAEGVEAKEQVEFLADQGCDMIQGFIYARPEPKGEFEHRMQGNHGSDEEKSE